MQKINGAVKEKTKRKRKPLEDLTISDNFIFTRVMQNKIICERVASIIMSFKIRNVELLETEKTLDVIYDAKSIRMDVYLKSENKIINIEMQVVDKKDLAKRIRFYRSIIDMESLSKGIDYKNLPDSYIIFICLFDPFGKDKLKYEFLNYDRINKVSLNDKSKTIIFNADKADLARTKDEKDLFNYICGKEVESDFIKLLNDQVELVKNNDIWKKEYMYLTAEFSDERDEGRNEGIIEGRNEGIIL